MTTTATNGPAFPQKQCSARGLFYDQAKQLYDYSGPHPGMTLRDYFAARAMQGWLSTAPEDESGSIETASLAEYAYEIADAMLKARDAQ